MHFFEKESRDYYINIRQNTDKGIKRQRRIHYNAEGYKLQRRTNNSQLV